MNKTFAKIGLVVVALVLVGAGCAKNDSNKQQAAEQGQAGVPVIAFSSIPKNINSGQALEVAWGVRAIEPGDQAVHTAVHYSYKSHSDDFDTTVTPAESEYETLTQDYASGSFVLPQNFPATIAGLKDGMVYLRAHVIINGKNYWTPEEQVAVGEKAQEKLQKEVQKEEAKNPAPATEKEWKEITMTAKQWTFEPARLMFKKGDNVRLKIKSTDVDHGFAIPEFGVAVDLKPGEEKVVEFTVDKIGAFTFYCNVYCGKDHKEMKGVLVVNE